MHIIDYWGYYSANPGTILAFWEGELAIWGGILGETLTAVIVFRIKAIPLARYADLINLGLLLVQAIGRIGDVINGEHISKKPAYLGAWSILIPVVPAMIYSLRIPQ